MADINGGDWSIWSACAARYDG